MGILQYLLVKCSIVFVIKCFEGGSELSPLHGYIVRKVVKRNVVAMFELDSTES